MLIRLIREYLKPYRGALTIIVALQFVSTVAVLYLPSLNAQIIDQGVAQGDTEYIVKVGGIMLAVSIVQIICAIAAVWFSARMAMSIGRDLRSAIFHRVGSFSTARASVVRRAFADHPADQRRAAGPDVGADRLHDVGRRARS